MSARPPGERVGRAPALPAEAGTTLGHIVHRANEAVVEVAFPLRRGRNVEGLKRDAELDRSIVSTGALSRLARAARRYRLDRLAALHHHQPLLAERARHHAAGVQAPDERLDQTE